MRKLKKYEIKLLMFCQKYGYRYIARDNDEQLWVFKAKPVKSEKFGVWIEDTNCNIIDDYAWLKNHQLKDIVLWEDEEATLIAKLLVEDKQ